MRAPRPALAVLAALSGLILTLLVAAPAGAEGWRLPRHTPITIVGHGYGHGHGMSQYGAEGAARQGLTWQQITGFYYPGTTPGRVRGRVSVLVSADTTDDLVVVPGDGLTVRDLGTGESWVLPARETTRWRVVERADVDRVQWLGPRRWRTWRRLSGAGAFGAGGQPVSLVTPAGIRAYRGSLAALPLDGGRVTVNDLRLEQYLRGVVPLEMPASWHAEALRAQAVAARTYAAYERAHPRSAAFDVYDTTASQVYGGVPAEHPASDAAVRATRRRILRSEGAPAFTQFGSSSGGWTSAGSVPYLVAQEDPYDDWSGNPVHDWSVGLTDRTLENTWPALGNLRRVVVSRDGHGEWGGRATSVRLVGGRSTVQVSGDAFRSVLGLRSTYLTLRVG